MPIPSTSDNDRLVYRCSEPDLILCSPECCNNAPIISIAWSEKGGSNKLAAVSASGRPPKILHIFVSLILRNNFLDLVEYDSSMMMKLREIKTMGKPHNIKRFCILLLEVAFN